MLLQKKTQQALEKLVDVSDVSYKRSLEYLFYGQAPSDPSELFRVVETGFPTHESYQVRPRSHLFAPLARIKSQLFRHRRLRVLPAFH